MERGNPFAGVLSQGQTIDQKSTHLAAKAEERVLLISGYKILNFRQ